MKVILFDFDGVIADTFSFCHRIINSRDLIDEDEYRARFEGNINVTSKAKTSSKKDDKPFDFFGPYTSALLNCAPNDGLADVIKSLSKRYTLIIISSTISPAISQFLELHHLREYFTEILGNDIEKSKVKKIQRVLEQYKISSDETILITDTLGDIREATQCDVRCIAVAWGYHSLETLQKGSPYKIVSRPKEILEAIESLP